MGTTASLSTETEILDKRPTGNRPHSLLLGCCQMCGPDEYSWITSKKKKEMSTVGLTIKRRRRVLSARQNLVTPLMGVLAWWAKRPELVAG